jgi:hypothetical protein
MGKLLLKSSLYDNSHLTLRLFYPLIKIFSRGQSIPWPDNSEPGMGIAATI